MDRQEVISSLEEFLNPENANRFIVEKLGPVRGVLISPVVNMMLPLVREELLKLAEMDPEQRREVGKKIIETVSMAFGVPIMYVERSESYGNQETVSGSCEGAESSCSETEESQEAE